MLKAAKKEYQKVVKYKKQWREFIRTNKRRKKNIGNKKTIIKKQKPQKYKKVVYEPERDGETRNIEQDTLEIEVNETEEKETEVNENKKKTNNCNNKKLKKQTRNKQVKKENLKYLII